MIGFGIAAVVVDGVGDRSVVGEDSAVAEVILGEGGPVETGERLELTAEERERMR